jgi:hypothetical protein
MAQNFRNRCCVKVDNVEIGWGIRLAGLAMRAVLYVCSRRKKNDHSSPQCYDESKFSEMPNDLLGICSTGCTKEGKAAFRQPNGWFV